MRRPHAPLTDDLKAGILAGLRAGKTVQIIHVETGVAEQTIRYTAAKAGIVPVSRYQRLRPGGYWRGKRGQYWRAIAADLRMTAVSVSSLVSESQ